MQKNWNKERPWDLQQRKRGSWRDQEKRWKSTKRQTKKMRLLLRPILVHQVWLGARFWIHFPAPCSCFFWKWKWRIWWREHSKQRSSSWCLWWHFKKPHGTVISETSVSAYRERACHGVEIGIFYSFEQFLSMRSSSPHQFSLEGNSVSAPNRTIVRPIWISQCFTLPVNIPLEAACF